MAPRFLILGGSGLIGKRLLHALGAHRTVATYHTRPFPEGVRFDATAERLADTLLRDGTRYSHAFVLQGIANIDACARDPDRTACTNVDALCAVIDDLVQNGIVPVFASSDAVFDGTRGLWREEDRIAPILTYGAQKARVEDYLAKGKSPYLVARIAKVVTSDPGEPGLIREWMEKLEAGVAIHCARDQIFSPVDADDVADALAGLALSGCTGIFHIGGPAAVTRLEFLKTLATEVARYRRIVPNIVSCSLRDFPFAEARPLDTSMSVDKAARALGRTFKDIRRICRDAADRRYGGGYRTPVAQDTTQRTS